MLHAQLFTPRVRARARATESTESTDRGRPCCMPMARTFYERNATFRFRDGRLFCNASVPVGCLCSACSRRCAIACLGRLAVVVFDVSLRVPHLKTAVHDGPATGEQLSSSALRISMRIQITRHTRRRRVFTCDNILLLPLLLLVLERARVNIAHPIETAPHRFVCEFGRRKVNPACDVCLLLCVFAFVVRAKQESVILSVVCVACVLVSAFYRRLRGARQRRSANS